ncbi:Glycosyl transferase, family 2 [Modestobacter italicus]|uniref:Glycosyl transferase, family 2 n=1 Tax=Modestobacter italicus (strain DSM 44449 / CECT 9708 / BC 501) TaxID=2732864 RepID=I4ETV5_MODI5|nr:glycosyltransferase [Modestobacter marinus]CCH86818.1 Glycosyl transferase, family 2 [Modestobacter marinus]
MPVEKSTAPLADVVICTYTDARWDLLERAVASVQTQSVAPGKILLCVDHNDELLERCLATWGPGTDQPGPPIEVFPNRFAGRLGSARNTAVERVTAEVVAFLDDDAEADPTWLETLLSVYAEDGAVAVGGAPLPNHQIARPGWFPHEFDWVFGCHYVGLPEVREPVRHLIGASMSVRTDALRAVGGFHSDKHDDMDLSHRIAAAHGAAAVVYEPKARIYHFVHPERLTWDYFWRRCYTINRGKVRAFSDMGAAGNIRAELEFARAMVGSVARKLLRAARGDRDAGLQAAAIVGGLAAAGVGHLRGRVDLRTGRLPVSLTVGLEPR